MTLFTHHFKRVHHDRIYNRACMLEKEFFFEDLISYQHASIQQRSRSFLYLNCSRNVIKQRKDIVQGNIIMKNEQFQRREHLVLENLYRDSFYRLYHESNIVFSFRKFLVEFCILWK